MSLLKRNIRIKHLVLAGHFIAFILLVSTCNVKQTDDKSTGIVHPSGQEFAGSESCRHCHPSVADSYQHTPHFLTSQPGTLETVQGSFDSGKNVLVLNERLKIIMERTPNGAFQRAMVDGKEVDRKPTDIVLGSGRQGQTFLFWQDQSLFQLPVSYHAPSGSWSNSPGYPTDQIVFDRSISARCLECHSTYAKIGRSVGGVETFDVNKMMLGIGCERCHGPAKRHVTFHQEHPEATESKYITNPAQLDRVKKLDNCALCHSGIRRNLMPSFSYLTGDNLDDFFIPDYSNDSAATMDVHGNQYGLLKSSKCFKMSTMDCSSCHNVHARETNQLELFSTRCMSCHEKGSDKFCKQPEVPGLTLSKNCIDCHMPKLPSKQVFLLASAKAKSTPFFVRTHLIGTYKEQVEAFLKERLIDDR
jgi:hypothetical protein